MQTNILTGDDTRFLAQQPEFEVDIMLGQMTTLMQNITNLQNDTDDKVKQLESQGWFKRMTNTLFGKNKATKQEIQKNNDKVVTYISQAVAQLYNMNLVNEKVICSLGNRMNEVYESVVNMNREQLEMKAQISEIMAVQQQTLESMGAFVSKLNEKIESVDNFHMLISEIQNGMYNDSSKLYNICSILAQLDKRQMDDNRKMNLLNDTMRKANIITDEEITVLKCLEEIVALPQEKIGLIYMELCNFRSSFPANLFADMIESYHFLSKMEKMSKKKEVIIQRVIDYYELDTDASFTIADISESFFENKQACFVDITNIQQIEMNNETTNGSGSSDLQTEWETFWEKNKEKNELTEEEFEFVKKCAEAGIAAAQYNLGRSYYYGKGAEKDYIKAVEWYRKAAEQGHAYAQNGLGNRYYNGKGVEKDYTKAVEWYRKAAEQGCDIAQYNLGRSYYYGVGVEKDYAKAVEWYRKAAEQGYHWAQYNLGWCYEYGNGVQQDYAKAVEWYKKSAEQGNDSAQYNLGRSYYYGKGVEKYYAKAVEWFRKAAEQGNAYAQNCLGNCYCNGIGVEKDEAKAVEWYRKAAEQGNVEAQRSLGSCYCWGCGVEKDDAKAMEWYKKAAEQGE